MRKKRYYHRTDVKIGNKYKLIIVFVKLQKGRNTIKNHGINAIPFAILKIRSGFIIHLREKNSLGKIYQ